MACFLHQHCKTAVPFIVLDKINTGYLLHRSTSSIGFATSWEVEGHSKVSWLEQGKEPVNATASQLL